MFEQDYIMRQIKEMVRVLLRLIFKIDMETASSQLLDEAEDKATLDLLLELVDSGNIDEAENRVDEMTEDCRNSDLKIALLFYSHLNDKSDEFLEAHNFSREEVKEGIKDLTSKYDITGMDGLFL